MKELFKKFHVIVLSFVLAISNVIFINQANAASIGGWSINNTVAQGASTLVNASKNTLINGANVLKKGTALITPNAAQVANVLKRGLGAAAIGLAVGELVGDGVDWVLDPANNRIRYSNPEKDPEKYGYLWLRFGGSIPVPYSSILSDSCQDVLKISGMTSCTPDKIVVNSKTQVTSYFRYVHETSSGTSDRSYTRVAVNPDYVEEEEKFIPLDVVAQKVISNANAGDASSKVATSAAAADILAEAEKDDVKARPIVQQLEQSAQTVTAEDANTATGQTKPNTQNPEATDLSLEFPAFCGWAPQVCEAAQVVISFPAKVEAWVVDLLGLGEKVESNTKTAAESTQAIEKELTKEDGIPQKDKTDINLPDLPITPQTVNVNWGGSCPAPTTTTISFGGQSQQITIMRYDFICEWAWVIKFSVIALASIGAVFIISGRKT